MSHQDNCPRWKRLENGILCGVLGAICWFCEINMRDRLIHFMPMLPALEGWLDGHDLESDEWKALYEYFQDSMDYGTLTGDTGTVDEWLADRPEYIEDLIADIQHYCIEEVSA